MLPTKMSPNLTHLWQWRAALEPHCQPLPDEFFAWSAVWLGVEIAHTCPTVLPIARISHLRKHLPRVERTARPEIGRAHDIQKKWLMPSEMPR